MPRTKRHLLILGGTTEARELADALIENFGQTLCVTTALAGRTRSPRRPRGVIKRGGFGGAAGLADWIQNHRVELVIDATHPFAVAMTRHAREAAARSGIPLAIWSRASWKRRSGDHWRYVDDLDRAASCAATLGRRIFVTTGSRGLRAFAAHGDKVCLVRLIEDPDDGTTIPGATVIRARGPFTLAGELALMRKHRIDVLVAKQSGGGAVAAKLAAARELRIPVVLVRKPREPGRGAKRLRSVPEALRWIAHRLDLDVGPAASADSAP
jgi:precorrin-6A/cobalt-precorrin-6A reductase